MPKQIMFSHETARGTVGLTPNKYTCIFTCTLYSVLFELVPTSAENILSRSGWLTYPSHIMPVQAFSIIIFSCLPERNIDVRIDQLLHQKYDRVPNTIENIHVGCRLKLQFLYDLRI